MTDKIESFLGSDLNYPPGTVIIWNSSPDNTPHGWLFCDGNNGTPDLRGKHLQCVTDSTTEPGNTNGADSYNLSESQLAPHSHSGSTDTTSNHQHTGLITDRVETDFGSWANGENPIAWYSSNHAGKRGSESSGNHTHTTNTGYTGSGNSIDNKPRTQTVNYIQKA